MSTPDKAPAKVVPARRLRPIVEWPEADQAAWAVAMRAGNPFEPGGLAALWAPATRRKTSNGYGRWIVWLDERGDLDTTAAPAARVTRERVLAYQADLRTMYSPHGVHNALQELGDAMRAMAPDSDWLWITRAADRLRRRARSVRDKASRLQSPERLAALGQQLMDAADAGADRPTLERAMLFRDGLIIAFLAYQPIRARNLAAITRGQHLASHNGNWWLAFAAGETKARQQPLEFPFPKALEPYLERYLATHRLALLTRGGRQPAQPASALWVSSCGTAMAYGAIAKQVRRHTRNAFGTALNPHCFRDCAATFIAIVDPEHVRIIAAILGHSTLATSERYYNQARGLEAGRRYHGTLAAIRSRKSATTEAGRAGHTDQGRSAI
jgi:integrase/recombinase XerD